MNSFLNNGSAVFQLMQAYGLGFISSFTPCVFPLIPITLALFGARESKSKIEGFALGAAYVLGIAFTYTILGMVSAKLGLVFGSLLGNPWVILGLSVFLLIVALQTLELIQLQFLSTAQTQASKVGGKGFSGAFLMGTVSGFVAAPCIGPALIIVLSAAAKSQSTAWGALLLFCYSIGLGTLFLLLATFSNLINKLPKSGNWLNIVKFFLGCLLLTIIIFISQNYLSSVLDHQLLNSVPYLLILNNISIFIAWIAYTRNYKYLKFVSAALMALCLYKIFVAPPQQSMQVTQMQPRLSWLTDYDEALKQSKQQNKPLLIDFFADWCAACKEFEHVTFSDQRVIEKLNKIITARIDFTDTTSDIAVKLTEKYQIPGLPVILLIPPNGTGEEIPDSRITGYLPPEPFLEHLDKYLK